VKKKKFYITGLVLFSLNFSFNQNKTHFSVGTQTGFQIYSCKPFKLETETTIGGIRIVEMLFRSNVLALVGKINFFF
jgi:WD repeat-containing protein 45